MRVEIGKKNVMNYLINNNMKNLQELEDRQVELENSRIGTCDEFSLYDIDKELKQIKTKIENIVLYSKIDSEV